MPSLSRALGRAPKSGRLASWMLAASMAFHLCSCQAADKAPAVSEGNSIHAASAAVDTVALAVDIGGAAADTVLLMPTAATRLSNGVIVVADPYVPAIRYFSPDGALIRSVGTKGEGPGEVESPFWLQQCGTDSVFAMDFGQMRMTVLDDAGSVVRQFRIEKAPGILECSRGGVLVGNGPTLSSQPSLHTRGGGPLRMWDREGGVLGTFGEVPLLELRPLGKVTTVAVSDSLIFVGTADSAWVEVLDFHGSRVASLSIGAAPRKATAREYDLAIRYQASAFRTQSERERSEASLRKWFPEPPDVVPPYTRLFVDRDETLWAVSSLPWDSVTVLQPVTATGRQLSEIRLPRHINVFEVGRGYVLGGYETEEGVPHVALYRIPVVTEGT